MTVKLGLWIVTTFILSIGLVVGLWALSKDIRDEPGSFLRQYPPHPVIGTEIVKLPDEHYYFAGATNAKVYLANTVKPFEVLTIDTDMSDTSLVHLDLGSTERLKYFRITVKIDSPYFYFMDGAIPYMYRGNTNTWEGEHFMKDSTYFIDALPISPGSFAISALSTKTNEKALGKLVVNEDVKLNHDLLERQFDGLFDVDGSLSYDKALNKLVYVYFYRNEYMVMDTNLNLNYRGNTIDTFRIAQVKTADVYSNKIIELSAPPVITNKSHAVYRQWLFIHSLLPAKNENMDQFNKASAVDVYNLNSRTYQFSFYIYDEDGDKLRNIMVHNNTLYALYERSIRSFDLVEKYFTESL